MNEDVQKFDLVIELISKEKSIERLRATLIDTLNNAPDPVGLVNDLHTFYFNNSKP
jgi:hypothetical protein